MRKSGPPRYFYFLFTPPETGLSAPPEEDFLRRAAPVKRSTQKRNQDKERTNGIPTIRILAASGLIRSKNGETGAVRGLSCFQLTH